MKTPDTGSGAGIGRKIIVHRNSTSLAETITSNRSRRRLPPYGRAVARMLATGKRIERDVWVFVGPDAWRHAKTTSNIPESVYSYYGVKPAERQALEAGIRG